MPGADANAGDSSRQRLWLRDAKTSALHAGLVVAAVLIVYANALPNAFLWDDLYLVVGNPAISISPPSASTPITPMPTTTSAAPTTASASATSPNGNTAPRSV